MVDIGDLTQAPVFGHYCQESMDYLVAGQHRESRSWMDGYELQFDEPAAKIKFMAMIPGKGVKIALERVKLVIADTSMSRIQAIAHYVRAFLEALPILGALILMVADGAVDAAKYLKTKKWQLDGAPAPLFEKEYALAQKLIVNMRDLAGLKHEK